MHDYSFYFVQGYLFFPPNPTEEISIALNPVLNAGESDLRQTPLIFLQSMLSRKGKNNMIAK
jgi:hypothetical protein